MKRKRSTEVQDIGKGQNRVSERKRIEEIGREIIAKENWRDRKINDLERLRELKRNDWEKLWDRKR